jgi:two-component system, LytTR family, response regulator
VSGLSVLAVDDEPPALDELTFLLESSSLIGSVRAARSAAEALHLLHDERYDVVLLDIAMPGIDGLELARILARFSQPPAVVFVTAHEEHALAAFDAGGMGYLLKPVTLDRLTSTLHRITQVGAPDTEEGGPLDSLLVETGTLTKIVSRHDVSWVESAGDYVRLHLREGNHYLLRLPISSLEEHWSDHGFARIHRSYLVALRDIRELRTTEGHMVVGVGNFDLPVSRRHGKELRDRLVRQAQRGRHDAN